MRIRRWGLIGAAMALGVCAGVAACAQADPAAQPRAGRRGGGQGRGGQFGGPFGGQMTLLSPQISIDVLARELKLTDDQKDAITKIRTKANEDRQALMAPAADGTPPNRQELLPKLQEINQKATTDVNAVLKDDQKTEAASLLKNLTAMVALRMPYQMYGDLKLTDDQKKKLQELGAAAAKDRAAKQQEMRAAFQAGDRDKAMQIQQSMMGNGQPDDAALAVLTADQKDTVTKYLKDHPARGGRPGGFGPGANSGPSAVTPNASDRKARVCTH